MTTPPWLRYESAARSVLEQIRNHLGIESIESKQCVVGATGTTWEIDAKAWQEQGTGFLVVEFRRYMTSRLNQEHLAALAFRIADVGASGGVVVSPLPLQKGAELVARSAGISHVRLTPESTNTDYLAEYIGQRFLGASVVESLRATDSMDAVVSRQGTDGT